MAKIKFFALVLVIMFFPVFSQESPDETVMDYVEEHNNGYLVVKFCHFLAEYFFATEDTE